MLVKSDVDTLNWDTTNSSKCALNSPLGGETSRGIESRRELTNPFITTKVNQMRNCPVCPLIIE